LFHAVDAMITCALSLSKRKIAPFDRLRAHNSLPLFGSYARPHGVRIPRQTLTTVLPVILTVVEMLLFDSTASANQFLGSVLTRTL
jgi:hypothetical protein